jgi:hypothetical protein
MNHQLTNNLELELLLDGDAAKPAKPANSADITRGT